MFRFTVGFLIHVSFRVYEPLRRVREDNPWGQQEPWGHTDLGSCPTFHHLLWLCDSGHVTQSVWSLVFTPRMRVKLHLEWVYNYTYLTGSLWGLNVKCSWQKNKKQTSQRKKKKNLWKQTYYTNTSGYWSCGWGNWGSGKLCDLLKVPWLETARTGELVLSLNGKGPRAFPSQPTLYPPFHTPRQETPIHPMSLPRKAHHDPTNQRQPPSSVKARDPSLEAWDGMLPSTMSPAQAPPWAHSDKELQWGRRWPGSRRGVQRDGGSIRAWSCESGTWRAEWRSPRFKGRHRGLTTRTTQQPYLLWLLCLSCQGSLTQCPLRDTGRRRLAQANCWLCPPWSHTSAPPAAAGASLGQTGAWLWWAMRKVICFCWRRKWNSQAIGEGGVGWGMQEFSSV